jgi:hypothetical protein
MNPDAEFDASLASHLQDADLPDQGFTRAVAARIERHRRRRFLALAGAGAVGGAMAAITASLWPVPVASFPAISPESIVAVLILVAVCGLVWIGTESGPLARATSRLGDRRA